MEGASTRETLAESSSPRSTALRERLLIAAMQSSPDAFVVLDDRSRVEWWNRAAERLFGWTVEEAAGRPLSDLVVPEEYRRAHDEGLRRRARGAPPRLGDEPVQVEAVCRDGRRILVELSVGELAWDGARRFHAFIRDVTERESARRALELSETRFRVAFENAPVGMLLTEVVDGDFGRVLSANPAAEEMLGARQSHLRHLSSADISHPSDAPLDAEMIPRLLDGEVHKLQYEKRYLRSDGSPVWVAFSATVVRSADGSPVHGIHQLVDISERRSAAQELIRLNRELRQANADLASANAELDGFTATVAHDLKNPLAAIAMHADLLAEIDEDGSVAQLRTAAAIARAAGRMNSLIEDLLLYSRADGAELHRERVDLEAMVVDVAAEVAVTSDRPIRVTHGPLPTLHMEGVLFRQVVSNVIGNGTKYVAPDVSPHVHVTAEQDAVTHAWTLRFSDNGIGVPPASCERVFEMFHREATDYPGTGIGLATCRRIVERHGGRIRIEPGASGGSVVIVSLPPDRGA